MKKDKGVEVHHAYGVGGVVAYLAINDENGDRELTWDGETWTDPLGKVEVRWVGKELRFFDCSE